MDNEPERPKDSDCCGSGCNPCIFDIYTEKLNKWKKGIQINPEPTILKQTNYLPYIIVSISEITHNLKIFQFQAIKFKKENLNDVLVRNAICDVDFIIQQECLMLTPGDYLIMKGNYENQKISRSYTPILIERDNSKGIFTIIVSIITHGKMSLFFNNLIVNDIIFWRGPFKGFRYACNSFDNLLLIGGGTGIVPLYNIAKGIVEDDKEETQVNFLCSFSTIKHILLRNEIYQLKDYWNFKSKFFISNQDQVEFTIRYNEIIFFKRIDEITIKNEIMEYKNQNFLVLISGPDGFNKFVRHILLKFNVDDKSIFIL